MKFGRGCHRFECSHRRRTSPLGNHMLDAAHLLKNDSYRHFISEWSKKISKVGKYSYRGSDKPIVIGEQTNEYIGAMKLVIGCCLDDEPISVITCLNLLQSWIRTIWMDHRNHKIIGVDWSNYPLEYLHFLIMIPTGDIELASPWGNRSLVAVFVFILLFP